jgi:hypothetical protein
VRRRKSRRGCGSRRRGEGDGRQGSQGKYAPGRADTEDMSSLSDAEILEQYKLARDTLVVAIADGSSVVEYRVGSRMKKTTDPVSALREIERLIAYYQAKADASSYGRARNYVEFRGRD